MAQGHGKTWLVVGASRGIGREFVRQALSRGDRVVATVRRPDEQTAQSLWPELVAKGEEGARCEVLQCDMLSSQSIHAFVERLSSDVSLHLDYVVLNAGVLKYPNRATDISYDDFSFHLQTNTIGPIVCAQALLKTSLPIDSITFISSDSGSAQNFRDFEDGFAAYGASKAALNHMIRHMAAELKRTTQGNGGDSGGGRDQTVILALHPGEVATDMASIPELSWEVEGQMTVEESVQGCIRTIETKTSDESGTFWTWQNQHDKLDYCVPQSWHIRRRGGESDVADDPRAHLETQTAIQEESDNGYGRVSAGPSGGSRTL